MEPTTIVCIVIFVLTTSTRIICNRYIKYLRTIKDGATDRLGDGGIEMCMVLSGGILLYTLAKYLNWI